MKRILLLLLLSGIISCEKDSNRLQNSIVGTWELRESSGTIAGYVHTFPAGNGNTITFTGDNHYSSVYINTDTTFSSSGTYELSTGSDCSGNTVVLLSYPPGNYSSAISVSGDTLHIDDNCISDGVYNQYQKIK